MGDAPEVKETAQQRAFAQLAVERYADYQKRWAPLQLKLAEDVKAAGRAGSADRIKAEGKASTDSAIRFGEAKAGVEGALASAGAAPGSGKFKMAVTGMGDDEATSRGLGMVASDAAVDDAYLQGLAQIAALGRGESASAVRGMGDIADMTGRQARSDAEMSASRRAGNVQLGSQLAGLGLAYASAPGAPAPQNRTVTLDNVNSWSPSAPMDQWGP
jgi:hypothetical protein